MSDWQELGRPATVRELRPRPGRLGADGPGFRLDLRLERPDGSLLEAVFTYVTSLRIEQVLTDLTIVLYRVRPSARRLGAPFPAARDRYRAGQRLELLLQVDRPQRAPRLGRGWRAVGREILSTCPPPPTILIDHVRDGLSALSDKAHQRNVWMRLHDGGQMDSFEEAVCRVFDDSGLGDALDKGGAVPLIGEEAVERPRSAQGRLVGSSAIRPARSRSRRERRDEFGTRRRSGSSQFPAD